jgi:hypothetical protein
MGQADRLKRVELGRTRRAESGHERTFALDSRMSAYQESAPFIRPATVAGNSTSAAAVVDRTAVSQLGGRDVSERPKGENHGADQCGRSWTAMGVEMFARGQVITVSSKAFQFDMSPE